MVDKKELARIVRDHRRNRQHFREYKCLCGQPLRSNSHYVQGEHIAEEIIRYLEDGNDAR